MTKIVVTGCAGFVGSWICEKAILAEYEVIGIDNFSSGTFFTPGEVKFHQADICDANIKDILKDASAIVHAAAYAELRHNWSNKGEREKLFLNNEIATRNVLEQMPDVPIIFLSSGSVYGSLSNNKIKDHALTEEDAHPEFIESPYAASKLACEGYVAAWSHKRKTPWYVLRLVNQIGARAHRGVIVDFLRMVKQDKHIHAADNGVQTKNWVSVKDTANVVMRLLDDTNRVPSGIYSVTSTERWSWRDMVDVMLKMYKEKYPNEEDPFTLTYEDRLGGSVGDPLNLNVSGAKLSPYYICNESVERAVIEALSFLGWPQ